MSVSQPWNQDAERPEGQIRGEALLALFAAEGLALVDPESGATSVSNPAFRRLCGLGPNEEIVFADLLREHPARAAFQEFLAAGPVPGLRQTRLRLRLPSGAFRPAEVRIAWAAGLDRDMVAVAVRDLAREEELAGLAAQGRRLRNMGLLATSLVHRFNNLLGVVTGYASQLQGVVGEGREEHTLRQILAAGQEAARIGAGIARVVSGLDASAPGPFDLRAELQVLKDLLEKLAQRRRIDLVLDAPSGFQTFGRAELLRDLLLEVTMQRFLACADQGRFTIRLRGEPGLFSHGGRRGRGWLCLSWEGVPLAPAPAPSPLRTPPEWPAFLAQVLGGELEEPPEAGAVRLHLPWFGRKREKRQ